MKKIFLIINFILFFSFNAYAESLGNIRTVNYYLEQGYLLVSVRVMEDGKLVYNLINNGKEEKKFELQMVSCIYDVSAETTDCYKP